MTVARTGKSLIEHWAENFLKTGIQFFQIYDVNVRAWRNRVCRWMLQAGCACSHEMVGRKPSRNQEFMRAELHRVLPLLVVTLAVAMSGCSANSHPASSTANNLWIATQNDQMIRSYTIDQTTGAVSSVGSNGGGVATGLQPGAIALSPDRITMFVANSGDNTISLYTINSDGRTLTPAGQPVSAGNTPVALVIDPANNLLFVADKGSDSIMVLNIAPGVVTVKTSFPIQTPAAPGGSGPNALALSPNGFSCTDNRTPTPITQKCFALYAANQIAGTVTSYDYFVDSGGNFVRGSIDLLGNFIVGGNVPGSPYSAGTNPSALAFSRCAGAGSVVTSCQSAGANGLLVANSGSNDITVFSACIQLPTCQFGEATPDGTLSQIGLPVPTGNSPSKLLIDPVADFVYTVDVGDQQVSEFQYNSGNGTLSALGAVGSGNSPLSGAVTQNFGSGAGAHNWVVVIGSGSLSTLGIGADGTLGSPNSGSVTGQPAAILIE